MYQELSPFASGMNEYLIQLTKKYTRFENACKSIYCPRLYLCAINNIMPSKEMHMGLVSKVG